MFNNILVPIDIYAESPPAQQLAVAKRIAEANGGKMTVVYVLPSIPGYAQSVLPSGTHANVLAEAEKRLKEITTTAELSGDAELVLLEGHPARAILDHANEIKADLIVMASHDPNITDYLIGSTASRVVHHAHCSIFVVRKVND